MLYMSLEQQDLDYRIEIDQNQKQIRDMVMESYHDIAMGKGRDCNEFFEELQKRLKLKEVEDKSF